MSRIDLTTILLDFFFKIFQNVFKIQPEYAFY